MLGSFSSNYLMFFFRFFSQSISQEGNFHLKVWGQKNCACHKMVKVVVRQGCIEIGLHPSPALKVHSELAFVAGKTRIILTKDMTPGVRDQTFFVIFEEINDIIECITMPVTLPETVIGLCQYR